MSACPNDGHYLLRLANDANLPGCDQVAVTSGADTKEIWSAIGESCAVSEGDLAKLVATRFKIDLANLDAAVPASTGLIPASLAHQYQVFPIHHDYQHLTIATSDPFNVDMERMVRMASGRRPVTQIAGPMALEAAIQSRYSPDRAAERLLKSVGGATDASVLTVEASEPEEIGADEALSSPVVKLTNLIIREAVQQGASDIHLQPTASGAVARFRVDGVLHDFMRIPIEVLNRVISRIKIIGQMDITVRFQPQDGRARAVVDGLNYDLRISTVPTRGSEKAVIRVPAAQSAQGLDALSMPAPELARFRNLMAHREGIVLVTGPTGSGKTTSMYGALQELSSEEMNIVTIEDPVEYEMPGFTQMQVDLRQDLTFASALRAVLRQDPDVIFIGEIRDEETAAIAVQASLTGHLVLATIHANSAIGAIRRMADLGLDSASIASTLRGSLAQRLARKICSNCAAPVQGDLSDEERRLAENLGAQPSVRATGCDQCGQTGYRGRIPIVEVMTVDSNIEALIHAGAPAAELEQAALANGLRKMKDVAMEQIQNGETSLQEVERVLGDVDLSKPRDARRNHTQSLNAENVVPIETPSVAGDDIQVLVVDDDGATRTIARALLEREGYRVTEASDGEIALGLLRSSSDYTLVVLDLDMPSIGGREVLAGIRSNIATAGLPVIILTGSGDEASEIELMECGADDYIRKPLEPSRFLARVRATLRRART